MFLAQDGDEFGNQTSTNLGMPAATKAGHTFPLQSQRQGCPVGQGRSRCLGRMAAEGSTLIIRSVSELAGINFKNSPYKRNLGITFKSSHYKRNLGTSLAGLENGQHFAYTKGT